MVTAAQVDVQPCTGWKASQALNFPETWSLAQRHRDSKLPMGVATFMAICFEETACCNIVQESDPIAIGPGQLQASEHGKVEFFAGARGKDNFLAHSWDSSMTLMKVVKVGGKLVGRWRGAPKYPNLPALTQDVVLGNHSFSIEIHLKYFQWLAAGHADDKPKKELSSLLSAQTGNDAKASAAFQQGGAAIAGLVRLDPRIDRSWTDEQWRSYFAMRRLEFANALNKARVAIKGNPVPLSNVKFWEFFLPDDFLRDPAGCVLFG